MTQQDAQVGRFVSLAQSGQRESASQTLEGLRRRLLETENDALSQNDLQMVVTTLMQERYLPEAQRFLEGMSVADRLTRKNKIDIAQVAVELGATDNSRRHAGSTGGRIRWGSGAFCRSQRNRRPRAQGSLFCRR